MDLDMDEAFVSEGLDYQRIEKAIGYLESHRFERPSLQRLATELGLSASHTQRLFQRWAGISPKRFLQFLTIEHAKQVLHDSQNVLEASWEVGVSGPGRLHDLFVSMEAVTPGEFKTRGNGLVISYGWVQTPFGRCFLAVTERGVCELAFANEGEECLLLEQAKERWPKARWYEQNELVSGYGERIFSRAKVEPKEPLSLFVKGTNFQIQVWRALLALPLGSVCTYSQLASQIGRPKAARALGNAVGANTLAYIIPCHRVIQRSGNIGKYRWGSTRKRALLAWESARCCAGDSYENDLAIEE